MKHNNYWVHKQYPQFKTGFVIEIIMLRVVWHHNPVVNQRVTLYTRYGTKVICINCRPVTV